MTRLVDLMPESSKRRLGQSRLIRRWILLYSATVIVIALGAFAVSVVESRERREVEALRVRVDFDAEQRAQAQEIRARIESLTGAINRYRRLAWPVDVSEVIAVIGDLAPESVCFDSLAVIPREKRVRAPKRGDKRGEDSEKKRLSRTLMIEITGVAPDDFHMANFIGGLEGHPLFEHIAVDYARETTLRGADAREFGLTCEIDFNRRYEFASADGEEAP